MTVDFNEVLSRPEDFSEEKVEAASFLGQLDWEGGLTGLLAHSGAAHFPEALREEAERADAALGILEREFQNWQEDVGVHY